MKRNIRDLGDREYDLIVVGGGIFGACSAWDATRRGLRVALLEKRDFSHATSANHLKMVHGGIRYLQHGDVVRVRESSRERAALLRIAPHLVRPLPIVMPTYGHGKQGKGILRAGIALYDFLTFDRNRRIPDTGRQIPEGRMISRQEVLKHYPGIDQRRLTGAAVFHDGQIYNPPRLALSFIRSAAEAGADVANYVDVTGFLRKGDTITGVRANDMVRGEPLEVRGQVVLNTAGPWAAMLLEAGIGSRLEPKPVFSRDVCFVVPRRLSSHYALACQTRTKDADAIFSRGGRHLFFAPWREYTLIGVWHGVYDGSPDNVAVTGEELQAYLDETNDSYPGLSLSLGDVSMVNTGLILFAENKPGANAISFGKRSLLIDHDKNHRIKGLVTLIGVRATMARGMAEQAVDLAIRKLGRHPARSTTENDPIYGGRIDHFEDFAKRVVGIRPHGLDPAVIRSLVQNYGCEYPAVLKYIDGNPDLVGRVGRSTVLKAEIVHAVREEMAEKLGDVVFRRTDLGSGGHPGEEALQECARLVALESGWTEDRTREEIEEVLNGFPHHRETSRHPGAQNTPQEWKVGK